MTSEGVHGNLVFPCSVCGEVQQTTWAKMDTKQILTFGAQCPSCAKANYGSVWKQFATIQMTFGVMLLDLTTGQLEMKPGVLGDHLQVLQLVKEKSLKFAALKLTSPEEENAKEAAEAANDHLARLLCPDHLNEVPARHVCCRCQEIRMVKKVNGDTDWHAQPLNMVVKPA